MSKRRPLVLAILDGWGLGHDDAHNSIFLADTPTIDHFLATYPNGPIGAAGEHIGLDPGHQGSTEIGHLVMSAGRVVELAQMQLKRAMKNGTLADIPAYAEAVQRAVDNGTRVHIMGLLSDAGVHSYDQTAHLLLELCAEAGLPRDRVYVHIFSDGRDTPPNSLPGFVASLQEVMERTGVGIIASVQGRYWAMDRDHRWERVQAAYELLTRGAGRNTDTIESAITLARTQEETDEFIAPTSIDERGIIRDGDVVINFNYRVDREIEITQALIEDEFTGFKRSSRPRMHYVATLPYYEGMNAPAAFERKELSMRNILPEVLANEGLTQYRITETEKWAYVTKIFNAMREDTFEGEDRKLIPSDDVATYDLKPEMQAVPIGQQIADVLRAGTHDVIVTNICNADMLGHTGNKEAAIEGCTYIDKAMTIIYEALKEVNGIMCITADHGDAEVMWDHDNDVPHTQHTDNFVPFILVDDQRKHLRIRETGALKDVAPTILELLGIEKPAEMTGESLLVE